MASQRLAYPPMGVSVASAVPWEAESSPGAAELLGLRGGPLGPWLGVHSRSFPNSGSESSDGAGYVSGGVLVVNCARGLVVASVSKARRANGANRVCTS
jgi:hypothetical protein